MSDLEKARDLLADFRWDLSRIVQGIDDLTSRYDYAQQMLLEVQDERRTLDEESHRMGSLAPGLWLVSEHRHSRSRRYLCTQLEVEAMSKEKVQALLAVQKTHDACCQAVVNLWETSQHGRGTCAYDVVSAVLRAIVEEVEP